MRCNILVTFKYLQSVFDEKSILKSALVDKGMWCSFLKVTLFEIIVFYKNCQKNAESCIDGLVNF